MSVKTLPRTRKKSQHCPALVLSQTVFKTPVKKKKKSLSVHNTTLMSKIHRVQKYNITLLYVFLNIWIYLKIFFQTLKKKKSININGHDDGYSEDIFTHCEKWNHYGDINSAQPLHVPQQFPFVSGHKKTSTSQRQQWQHSG